MKTVELHFAPGDIVYIRGEKHPGIIESIVIDDDVTYNWYSIEESYEYREIWNDGEFDKDEIGKTVFATLEELEKAFPEDFTVPEEVL